MIHCACYSINPCFRNGVAGAGTTFYYEVCYMSGQSIVAPSGGYADGCLTVTPGCSFTVTVGCVGGTSGFGTYISATGGSVAITQRPKVTCHPINNSCYILCAYDSGGSLVSIAQTNTICCCGTFRISDPNTCFVHNYENCCAQATLTAGVGTAWEGMSNVIVRSGAAGTIFHPDEYSFSGCLTADCCTTTCQASIFTASIVGIACTSSNTFVCVPFHCILTCFGICATTASTKPITVSNYSESFITRCWGGASAGNYFGDGINQSDYDVFCICKIASGIGCLGDFTVNCLASPVCNYVFGPLLTCCGQISNTIECISFSTNFRTPQGIMYECKYGAQGGAGIKSPGTKSLSGSGKAPCVCALTCGVGNTLLFYLCMDDRNGPFQIARTYPPACSCGVICCRVAQDTIDGCDYWYPEDMRGHSNVCLGSPFSNVCGQPGAGGHSNCLYRAGVMGGTVVSYSTGSCWPQKIFDAASTCNCVCGGGSIGFDCYSIYNGHICCSADLRCLNWTTGLVIVYY
jgi:hypothetical protein